MPDPIRQTISATEVPALFNASPYTTRWMLHQRFAGKAVDDKPADARMDWGKRLEPLVIAQAADDLRLEVRPNSDGKGMQVYERRGRLGCTRDATIIDPSRGPGSLETKCVFDYRIWMTEWAGGKAPPRHYELQLQTQMCVGDGETPHKWGVLAAWLGGEVHYFERSPLPELWEAADIEAGKFFDDVKAGREPEPVGEAIEAPLLKRLYPVRQGDVLDMTDITDPIAKAHAELCAQFAWHRDERLGHQKGEEKIKAQLLALARGHERIELPYGINVKLKETSRAGYTVKPTTYTTVDVFVPDNVPRGNLDEF